MAQVEPFPWQSVMAFGFGHLRLSSQQFWSLSMPELQAALKHANPNQHEAVDRSWLHQVMSEYPDVSHVSNS